MLKQDKPSARVDCISVYTGFPAAIAAVKLAHFSDSTPWEIWWNQYNYFIH